MAKKFDPQQAMADARHEFGEHGGVNMSIAASTTYTVMSAERASKLMDLLQNEVRFGFIAVSLGYFDTLLTCPGASTSSEMGEDALHDAGISLSLVRFSVGLTGSVEERWDQLAQAINMCD